MSTFVKHSLFSSFLFTVLFQMASFTVQAQTSETAVITFLGANYQKDAKLEIKFNGQQIGYLTRGLEMKFTTTHEGEATITTQGYNMIDAMYGPPVQFKLSIVPGATYYLDAKWSKSQHLQQVSKEEVPKLTKNGKKIFSTIEVSE